MKPNFIIGIGGGTGAGKSLAAKLIKHYIRPIGAVIISTDDYYRDLSHLTKDELKTYNFDHPRAFDHELFLKHLERLKAGESILMPSYDFKTHARKRRLTLVKPRPVIIVEGLFALVFEPVRRLFDLSVYIDTSNSTRFARRLERDTRERGRTPESVTDQYLHHCRPMHEKFIAPTKKSADLVISGEKISRENLQPVLERIRTSESI